MPIIDVSNFLMLFREIFLLCLFAVGGIIFLLEAIIYAWPPAGWILLVALFWLVAIVYRRFILSQINNFRKSREEKLVVKMRNKKIAEFYAKEREVGHGINTNSN